MSIVFSAFVPHSPFLIPSIGKENLKALKKTEDSFKLLEENLYASKAETLFIISPHGLIQANSFSMNLSPDFECNFEEFGDLATKINYKGDIGLAHKIRENLETKAPLQLMSDKKLDYGSSIPLYLLTKHIPDIKIIPIYYSNLDLDSHFKFGQVLKRELMIYKKRIGIIASGDLSHKLSKTSPAGYSPKANKFDNNLIKAVCDHKTSEILQYKKAYIHEVSECGLKSIIILLGILDGVNYKPELLSYEHPFGVGYLAMNFKL